MAGSAASAVNPWLIGAGVGSDILGAILQNSQMNKQNQRIQDAQNRLYGLGDQENSIRMSLMGNALPQMGQTLGIPGLGQLGAQYARIGAQPSPYTNATGAVPSVPGMSAAGKIGMAAMGLGPLLVANKFGAGHRTADTATGEGGFEQVFGQRMADIVKQRDAGDKAGAAKALQQAYLDYQQATNAYRGKGGNYRKVAEQSLTNQPLQQTYRSIAQSLGMGG